jgi:hypothetical protein
MAKKQTELSEDREETMALHHDQFGSATLLDRLRARRAELSSEFKRKISKFDRQIQLLEASDAETIVKESEDLLDPDPFVG